jgi:hypothetical protein
MSEAVQLALFNDVQNDEPDDHQVDWSYSRRQTLEHCARRYYYEYYGAKVRVAVAEPRKEEIRFLSDLSNRYLRSGEILHLAIKSFFTKDDAGSWLVDWASRIYREDYKYSKNRGQSSSNSSKYLPKMLMEFYYGQPDADRAFTESENRLIQSLQTFLSSPVYAFVRNGGKHPTARVEARIRVESKSFTATGKADVTFPHDNHFVIVDWKIGNAEASADSLQLAFYALWAIEVEGHRLEDIAVYKAQLANNSLQPVNLDETILLRVQSRILQDIERMNLLDSYGIRAVADAFPTCSLPRVCKLCVYQGICPGVAV